MDKGEEGCPGPTRGEGLRSYSSTDGQMQLNTIPCCIHGIKIQYNEEYNHINQVQIQPNKYKGHQPQLRVSLDRKYLK